MSYEDDLHLIDCIRDALGKAPLPDEPPDTGVRISLDGVRWMTPSAWATELRCSKQAVSQRYERIRRRIDRGDPSPYAYNPNLRSKRSKRGLRRLGAALLTIALLTGCHGDPWASCPSARKRGFRSCHHEGLSDRISEFKRANKLTATCDNTADISAVCSGVTANGIPIRFTCDGRRCEFIANWMW